jgi:hypothetical protein
VGWYDVGFMKLLRFPLLIVVFAVSSFAQKTAFTLEQVMSSPFPTALTSAAKANRIAWVFDSKGERNIWVADAPDFAARQITHYQGDDGQDIFAVRLTPDGKTVVFARGSEMSSEGHVANPSTESCGFREARPIGKLTAWPMVGYPQANFLTLSGASEPIASASPARRRDPRNTVFRGRPCHCGTP